MPMTMPATTNAGTRMKWATGINGPPNASAQNIPTPESVRNVRSPGLCSTIVAVPGRGEAPKAVMKTGSCCSVIKFSLRRGADFRSDPRQCRRQHGRPRRRAALRDGPQGMRAWVATVVLAQHDCAHDVPAVCATRYFHLLSVQLKVPGGA